MVRHTFWKSNFGKMILQVFKIIWERWPKFNHVSKCTDPSDVRTVSFCMWNFVWKNKAQLALFPQTKFHIQKCDTCRSIEKPSRGICYLTMVQHSCRSTRVYTPTKFSTCSYLGTVRYTHSLVHRPCVHRVYTVGLVHLQVLLQRYLSLPTHTDLYTKFLNEGSPEFHCGCP